MAFRGEGDGDEGVWTSNEQREFVIKCHACGGGQSGDALITVKVVAALIFFLIDMDREMNTPS